ncbi:MAG TPA: AbrB/MazE/SpoVT family DNA-binding domain-containing protein [Thermomicrobiaceae bacterium]|nr:AbrB/MazE/SpoVT family DNA-binding domain-containing protein [Thermomicrobiaceae bacterium]
MEIVKVDEKGRIQLPKKEREAHGMQPGAQLAIEWEGEVMRVTLVPNPFDALADEALTDYHAGSTRRLTPRTR